jgi:cytochrome c
MKFATLLAATATVATLASGSVQAAPDVAKVKEILAANACLACHAIDKKVVGPAYQDVGAKYKGKDGEAATIAKHIREGVSGLWGAIPMPPNKNISDADINVVVQWLIAGAPQ